MDWVGRPLPRYEDPVLLQGRGRYTADLADGARAMRFVRSPVARGRILAVKAPSGATVITAADLDGVKPICPRLDRPDYVAVAQPILARERVSYVGEPIAAVIAETVADAEDLAEQVEIELAAETPVVTLDQALAPGAPLVHDAAAHNTLIDARFETPGVAAAFAAAHAVVEFEFTSRRQAAMPLEARGAVAARDPATGRVTLTVSAQMPHLLRTAIADALGMPESDLRVIAPEVGGGFGQKMALAPEQIIAVWAARRFGYAVAWIEDRLENLTASAHSRDQRLLLRGAFDADGRLLTLDADVLCNVGAYSTFPATCGVEPLMALADLPGPYRVPEYRARARAITTNTCPMAPYRGVSRPVITAAIERLMDDAAARLGLDALEIRRRNLIAEFPHTSATGIVQDGGSYREAMEAAAGLVDIAAFRARQHEARAEDRYLGLGVSVFCERTGPGSPAFGAPDGAPAGLRGGRAGDGPVGLSRGADRQLAARSGLEDEPGAAARRRNRNHARPDPHRLRRYRPHPLWLGHLRQPLAGDRRRRLQARWNQVARPPQGGRSPAARSRSLRHRIGRRPRRGARHRSRRRDQRNGARCLFSEPP